MTFWRRRARGKRSDRTPDTVPSGPGEDRESAATTDDAGTDDVVDGATQPTGRGPWDLDDVPELGRRIDLGALRIPGRPGMGLRMEVEKSTQRVTAASVQLSGSILQLQAFAAPRSEGIWDEIRAEIKESVIKQGGSADEIPGPFGRELLARLPTRTPEGRTGHRPARFIGHDGPRWFLRGVLTGKAAVDPEAAKELEDVFADVVVVRGTDPRPPRDLLALTLPDRRGSAPSAPEPGTALDPLHRGPEITEVR